MLSHSALLLLAAFLYSTPSTALSYSMISTKDQLEDFKETSQKTYAQTRPIGCTLMSETSLIPTGADPTNIRPSAQGNWAGISIHQDNWSPEAKWIGFWAKRECNRNLPSLIIHWYPESPTDQVFDIRRLRDYLPRLSEGDYRYMSWGEMVVVPQAITDNVAPGSVAVREKKPSRILGSQDQAWYGIFEDVVLIRSNPYDQMENDLAGFSERGAGRQGKQLHLTFNDEQFTRAIDGPGGEDYPIPEDQLQDEGQPQIEEQVKYEDQVQEEEQVEEQIPVSRQPSGQILNSQAPAPAEEGGSDVSSDQQYSLEGFPEATVLLRLGVESPPSSNPEAVGASNTQIITKNIPASFQQGNMEEEIPGNIQNPQGQGQPENSSQSSEISLALRQLKAGIRNVLSNLESGSLSVDTVLANLGTDAERVALLIPITGTDSALVSVLNRISTQRLHLEMSSLTPVQTMELAGHQIANWGPFALANSLGEARVRREVAAGVLVPAAADDMRAEGASVGETEFELANKIVQDVITRGNAQNQAQNLPRVEPGPELEIEGTLSNNDLLENLPPINSPNSLAGGRLPGGNIEFEEPIVPVEETLVRAPSESGQSIIPDASQGSVQSQPEAPAQNLQTQSQSQGLENEDDDEAWKAIMVHGPVEEEVDGVRRLNRGDVMANLRNRVSELRTRERTGNSQNSASESEVAPVASSESQSESAASESSSYVPQGWESEYISNEDDAIEEEDSATIQEEASPGDEEEFITSQDESSQGDYDPSSPEDSDNSPVPGRRPQTRRGSELRRGRSRGRPRT
ncbi:hypothetical protein TWF506_005773 [Arthrobotrys conoides]|uniref:Uncharacterized protein n=1 Tax=Arthrobotrys conoides TaxID=74498 RepID=A0AAN8S0D3_9PEZI